MANKTCVVVGGGISGLTAAWNLARKAKNIKVVLLEASQRVGGWVWSKKTRQGGIFELGPRSLRVVGNEGAISLAMVRQQRRTDGVLIHICASSFTDNLKPYFILADFNCYIRTSMWLNVLTKPFQFHNQQ